MSNDAALDLIDRNGLPIFRSNNGIGYTEPPPSCIVWESAK